jgi:hypothetical protein
MGVSGRVAMQKVEGSSPFIRSSEGPGNRAFLRSGAYQRGEGVASPGVPGGGYQPSVRLRTHGVTHHSSRPP